MEAVTESQTEAEQLLTFRVGGEVHALPLLGVREILPFTRATPIPAAPPAIRGLTNLRGTAVPLIDLAIVFGKPPTPISKRACVIILDGGPGTDPLGVVTDEVLVVVGVPAEAVEPAPALAGVIDSRLTRNLACVDGDFLPILDVGRILSLQHRSAGAPDPEEEAGDVPNDEA